MVLDESLVGMLLLWTFIRWERRFPLTAMEEMGVDIWAFTRDVDQLLENEKIQKSGENSPAPAKGQNDPNPLVLLRELTNRWLQRAEDEARSLGHAFLAPNIFCWPWLPGPILLGRGFSPDMASTMSD